MKPQEIADKYFEKTKQTFFHEFVQYFPTEKDFNEWLKSKGLSMDEDKNGHMDWYPEGELWEVGHLFGIDLENVEQNTENYSDFFNELVENNW